MDLSIRDLKQKSPKMQSFLKIFYIAIAKHIRKSQSPNIKRHLFIFGLYVLIMSTAT